MVNFSDLNNVVEVRDRQCNRVPFRGASINMFVLNASF